MVVYDVDTIYNIVVVRFYYYIGRLLWLIYKKRL